MKFTKHLLLGYRNYWGAIQFIGEHKLWRFFLFPMILFGVIFYFGYYFQELRDASQHAIDVGDYTLGFIGKAWLWIKGLFQGLLAFLFLDATKYVVMIVLSPLIASLSERTERILTGNKYKFNLKQLIKDVKRGIGIAIRMLLAESIVVYLVWMPICWIFNISEPIFLLVKVFIGFYFYGFGFIDYINERLRLSISESWTFMKKHAGLAIAIGSVYSLLFYVPSLIEPQNKWIDVIIDNIGVIFAPVLAVVAATMAMHELVDLSKNKFAVKKEK